MGRRSKGVGQGLWSTTGNRKKYYGTYKSIAEVREVLKSGSVIWVQEYDEMEQKYQKVYYTVGEKYDRFFKAEKNKTGRVTSFLYQQVITGEVTLVK